MLASGLGEGCGAWGVIAPVYVHAFWGDGCVLKSIVVTVYNSVDMWEAIPLCTFVSVKLLQMFSGKNSLCVA